MAQLKIVFRKTGDTIGEDISFLALLSNFTLSSSKQKDILMDKKESHLAKISTNAVHICHELMF